MLSKGALLVLVCLTFHSPSRVKGHGFLQSPRSRNFYAHDIVSTNECSGSAGCPPAEYCQHCLNGNTGVCGKSPSHNYETSVWLDRNGDPMPWLAQATYHEGGTMKVDSYLDTHHNGHMEIRACVVDAADPGSCTTPEEFEGNELHFVQDLIHPEAEGSHPPMYPDPMYPERGMYAGGQGGATKSFSFEYRLPSGMNGERVLLQWKYITANSCSPPGYAAYFAAHPDLPNSYWTQGVSDCTPPYPNDGSRSTTFPEQFFNCAEVTILSAGTSSPTISRKPTPNPTTAQPTFSKPPTKSPIVGGPTCLAEWQDCTYDWQNCCAGSKCKQIDASGYGRCLEDTCYNKPPSPPTNQPPPTWNTPTTPNPTPKPTSPTGSPPTPPTNNEDACCTINLRDCHHPEGNFCRLNQGNCEGPCGKLWLPNGPLNGCIALWEQGCSSDSDCCQHGKCSAGSCESDDPWLKDPSPTTEMPTSKMPMTHTPTTSPTTQGSTETPTYYPTNKASPICTVCDDKETNWQIKKGFDCTTDTLRINDKCNKDERWIKQTFCRLSCYKAGNGYPGDVCCVDDPPPPGDDDDTADDDTGNDGDWEDGLTLTHYWDCSGQGCDATTLQPWDYSKYRASKGYQPQDPNDFGGAVYGEKLWVTGAVMNIDMGPSDSCCGDNSGGGCGKCLLISNPQSINPDWTAIVMKKNTCDSCQSSPHIDVNVPGFDVLQYSLANICGEPGTGLTKEQSATLGQWYLNHANTKEAQGLCDQLPPDYQKGCRLFAEWGWIIGNPSNASYRVVECPQAYVDFVGDQFDENGVTS